MQGHVDDADGPGFPPRRSQKYTIKSHFGHARTPRSRKIRPCDACRQRKTACVIDTEPPCLSCKRRGIACKASSSARRSSYLSNQVAEHGLSNAPFSPPFPAEGPELPADASRVEISETRYSSRPEAGSDPHSPRPAISVQPRQTPPQRSPADSYRYPGHPSVLSQPSPSAAYEATHSLEGVPNKTADSMGLSGEQDAFLLHGFRSFIMSENNEIDANIMQVYRGGAYPDDPPVHFMVVEDEFPEHNNAAKRSASEAIEATVGHFGSNLIRLYFKHIHPAYPVVAKASFLRQYAVDKVSIPASLRGAVYALASSFWHRDTSLPQPCPFEQHELVNHAHSALRRELEAPNSYKLQACLLLFHIRPPDVDSVETPYIWIQAAQATACAQAIGIHQDPTRWNISLREKKLRKKLWWAVYATDCWSAVGNGYPPHISPDSFSTPFPDMDDVRVDEDLPQDLWYLVDLSDKSFQVVDGVRFLESVKIAMHLREVLDCSFQVRSPTPNDPERVASRRQQLLKIRETFEYWPSLVPQCLKVGGRPRPRNSDADHNVPLHLSFYAAEVLLFRALMHPATRAARAAPDSNLRQWFPVALAEYESFTDFVESIYVEDLQGFWVRQARAQLITLGNFYIYLFLLASAPRDIEAAYRLLERFHQALQRLHGQLAQVRAQTTTMSTTTTTATATTTEGTKDGGPGHDATLLIRPVKLRIQSFFAHAADLIKSGVGAGDG